MQCYLVLGQERFLEPIYKGMEFYRISQDSCGAWGQQINMQMKAASARTYEPAAFLPGTTCENAMLLIRFYKLTGDKKFLEGIPKAIKWLEASKLPKEKQEGHRTHPTFVDAITHKPIYVHRKGSNVKFGRYYVDEDDKNLLSHYYGKAYVRLDELKDEYKKALNLSKKELIDNSPFTPKSFNLEGTPQKYYDLNRQASNFRVDASRVIEVVNQLDDKGRWLTTRAYISNPYIGDGTKTKPTDQYATTQVGDETDTSPYPNETDQEYISTGTYIRNMKLLINYIKSN